MSFGPTANSHRPIQLSNVKNTYNNTFSVTGIKRGVEASITDKCLQAQAPKQEITITIDQSTDYDLVRQLQRLRGLELMDALQESYSTNVTRVSDLKSMSQV
jgi:hypothetical protein